MLPKLVLLLIALTFTLICAGPGMVHLAVQAHDPYYNCLHLDKGVRVQLNTHLPPRLVVLSTSPDGNHRLLWEDNADQNGQRILQNLRSGQQLVIGNESLDHTRWSPNGEYVAFEMDGEATLINLRTHERTPLPADREYVGFSPTGDYLHLSPSYRGYGLNLFSTRTLAPVPLGFLPDASLTCGYDAWSPNDNRLACALGTPPNHTLIVIDLDGQRSAQIALPFDDVPLIMEELGWETKVAAVHWSPDGNYLAVYVDVFYPDPPQDVHRLIGSTIYFIAVSGNELTLRSHIAFEMAGWINYSFSHTLFTYRHYGVFANAHEYLYVQAPPDPALAPAPTDESLPDHFELWRYDFLTGEHERLATGIRDINFNGDKLALLLDHDDALVLEIRDKDGRNPVSGPLFPAELTRGCSWKGADVIACWDANGYGHTIIDAQGVTLWPIDGSGPQNRIPTYVWYADDQRFIIVRQQLTGQKYSFQLVDLHTQQTYTIPEAAMTDIRRQLAQGAPFELLPWPDDATQWVAYFGYKRFKRIVFRFDPATNTWERTPLVLPPVWSPDGARFAYVNDIAGPPGVDLWVQEADGTRQWYLGAFPDPMLNTIEWTQCGDVLAPLRDRLAAGRP